MIDGTLILMLVLLAAMAALAHLKGGSELLGRGLGDGASLLLRFAPVIVISFLAAGFVETLIPQQWVRDTLGDGSGFQGMLIASGVGAITPAGPFVSMPIAAVMVRSGAGVGTIVAYLVGWSLLSLHRLVAWEIPVLGWRFALLRFGICLALPLVAGLLARAVSRALPFH
ncbi:permease [Myxococcota bacterium]|nr:permease [Myxococcota bacterium]